MKLDELTCMNEDLLSLDDYSMDLEELMSACLRRIVNDILTGLQELSDEISTNKILKFDL